MLSGIEDHELLLHRQRIDQHDPVIGNEGLELGLELGNTAGLDFDDVPVRLQDIDHETSDPHLRKRAGGEVEIFQLRVQGTLVEKADAGRLDHDRALHWDCHSAARNPYRSTTNPTRHAPSESTPGDSNRRRPAEKHGTIDASRRVFV